MKNIVDLKKDAIEDIIKLIQELVKDSIKRGMKFVIIDTTYVAFPEVIRILEDAGYKVEINQIPEYSTISWKKEW